MILSKDSCAGQKRFHSINMTNLDKKNQEMLRFQGQLKWWIRFCSVCAFTPHWDCYLLGCVKEFHEIKRVTCTLISFSQVAMNKWFILLASTEKLPDE